MTSRPNAQSLPKAQSLKPKAYGALAAVSLTALIAGAAILHPRGQAAATYNTRTYVTTLASEKFEGRLTGSTGERLASDYLVSQLKRIGAKPLPGATDFLLPFDFTAGSRDGGSTATMTDTRTNTNRIFTARTDIQALSFSDKAYASGAVVFACYGIG